MAHCIPQGRRLRGRIPKLSHPQTAFLSLGTPNFEPHHLTPYNLKATGVNLVGHRQTSLAYILTGSVASRKVENSEAASLNSVSHRLYYRHYLATGSNFEPHSDPLLLKATGVHLVGHIQASQAYMLTGPVASYKVEDSEATSPNFASSWLYFHHYWLQNPTFRPIKTQSNGGTPSRPHSCVPGLHADRAYSIPQARRLRGYILKLSHLQTASMSLGTPTSSPILTPSNPKQRRDIPSRQ